MSLFNDDIGADIQGKYRYKLWRIWDRTLKCAMFIMLNPSTADGSKDDPTLMRCISIAAGLGFGGIYVGNLFALRSPYPKDLLKDPQGSIGERNDTALQEMKSQSSCVIFAWGNFGSILLRDLAVVQMFPDAFCLGQNDNGSPKHPLYVPNATVGLRPFKRAGDGAVIAPQSV